MGIGARVGRPILLPMPTLVMKKPMGAAPALASAAFKASTKAAEARIPKGFIFGSTVAGSTRYILPDDDPPRRQSGLRLHWSITLHRPVARL